MSEESIEKIKKKLIEIKVLGGNPNAISLKELKEIISLLSSITGLGAAENIILEHYRNNKKHILFSYFLAIFYYLNKKNGDNYLNDFFNQLTKLGKNNLLYLISMEILKIYESDYILNFLSNYYEKIEKKNELIDIWKRLLKKNPQQSDLMIKIAGYNAKTNHDESLKYYQLAFLNECKLKNYLEASSILKKIIDLNVNLGPTIFTLLKKIVVDLGKDEAVSLLNYYLKNLEKDLKNNFEEFIRVVKFSLENNILLKNQFGKLIESYKIKYQNHKNFEDILKLSKMRNLTKSTTYNIPSKVIELIKEFEKYVVFDEETFVYHRNFGVGLIKKINYDRLGDKFNSIKFDIDFKRKKNHSMSFRIAISSLVILEDDNLEALKLFKPDVLVELIKSSEKLLTGILHTLDAPVNSKDISDCLVEELGVFSKEEWKSKWNQIKKEITEKQELSGKFELTTKGVQFRTKSISVKKNILDTLNSNQSIKEKFKAIDFYLINHQIDEPTHQEIVKKIVAQIKGGQEGNLAGIIFLLYLKKSFDIKVDENLNELFVKNFKLDEMTKEFGFLNNFSQRLFFIELWYSNFSEDFSNHLKEYWIANEASYKEIPLEYLLTTNLNEFHELFEFVNAEYLKYSEAFFLMFKLGLNYNQEYFADKQSDCLIKLLRINHALNHNISIEKEVSFSKRLYSSIYNYLFKDNLLFSFIKSGDKLSQESKEIIFAELEKQTFLENYLKVEIKTLHAKFK